MPYLGDYDSAQEELETACEEVQRDVDALRLENQLFTRFLTRSVGEGGEEEGKRRRGKVATVMSVEQKLEVVGRELEEVTKDKNESKVASEKLIDTLRAVLEETDIRIAELKKDAYEFKRDIVVGAENVRTGE